MTEGNSSTSGVHLLVGQFQGVLAVDGHRGKGLVDFDDVEVVNGEVVFPEELGDGDRWADTHDPRGEAGDSGADELGEDGLAELDSAGSLHEEDGGGSVGDLRGVATGRPVSEGREGRADLGQAFKCGTPSWALVLGQSNLLNLSRLGVLDLGLDRHNLVVEPTGLLCLLSPPV